jgi:hypothetical protein
LSILFLIKIEILFCVKLGMKVMKRKRKDQVSKLEAARKTELNLKK